ncbi:hypothetical protein N7468_010250 [Penicillium chermesinum]|uniref:Uncharacterized protein n=1 Tax=Penicillium chermesinum TaxID=63820 RepID=A0A9W9NCB3_9EURO|nr:uncharacterized protein N7468_010250 [Penicillium chermesinum]KAJ5217242.1 hypothetical protein N7468_010250 [Penicillium chermesinum]
MGHLKIEASAQIKAGRHVQSRNRLLRPVALQNEYGFSNEIESRGGSWAWLTDGLISSACVFSADPPSTPGQIWGKIWTKAFPPSRSWPLRALCVLSVCLEWPQNTHARRSTDQD